MCSHIVGVAEVNSELFFVVKQKRKKTPGNLTNLLTATMPRGRGRKGGSAPQSRKPQALVTSRVGMGSPLCR